MSTIKLDDNYSIVSDANNFTLKFEAVTKKEVKGEMKDVKSTDEWNYPKMQQALNRYVDESVRQCEGIPEILSALNRVEKTITTLFN